MSDGTTEDAIKEIAAIVRGITGIKQAPDYALDQINTFPFALIYPRVGTFETAPIEVQTGLHTVVVEVHIEKQLLPNDIERVIGFIDSVPAALHGGLKDGDFSVVQTWERIRYEFGKLDWGGTETMGVRFYIEGVKVQATIA